MWIFCFQNKAKSQQDIILRLLLEIFPHLNFNNDSSLREKFDFGSHVNATAVLLEFMLDAVIMPYRFALFFYVENSYFL